MLMVVSAVAAVLSVAVTPTPVVPVDSAGYLGLDGVTPAVTVAAVPERVVREALAHAEPAVREGRVTPDVAVVVREGVGSGEEVVGAGLPQHHKRGYQQPCNIVTKQ